MDIFSLAIMMMFLGSATLLLWKLISSIAKNMKTDLPAGPQPDTGS